MLHCHYQFGNGQNYFAKIIIFYSPDEVAVVVAVVVIVVVVVVLVVVEVVGLVEVVAAVVVVAGMISMFFFIREKSRIWDCWLSG